MTARKSASKLAGSRLMPLLVGLEHGSNAVKESLGSDQTEFTWHCLALLAHPDNIGQSEWRAIILKILRKYVAEHPIRAPAAAEIAFLVESVQQLGNKSVATARREVADVLGKSVHAVKQAHNLHRA